jgi:hypothetical protein
MTEAGAACLRTAVEGWVEAQAQFEAVFGAKAPPTARPAARCRCERPQRRRSHRIEPDASS